MSVRPDPFATHIDAFSISRYLALSIEHQTILGQIKSSRQDIQELSTSMHGIERELESVKGDVRRLKGDMVTVQKDVFALKGDVACLRHNVCSLQSGVLGQKFQTQ